MISRIFVDANVPIYAAGRDHPRKGPSGEVMALAAEFTDAFFTDAEVVQELLHRYLALRLWPQGRDVVERFVAIMRGHVESIHLADVEDAMQAAEGQMRRSARDLLHLSVMKRVGARHIVSADRDFDSVPGLVRFDPAAHSTWRAKLSIE